MSETAAQPSATTPDFPAGIGHADGPDEPIRYTEYDVASALAVLRRADEGEPETLLSLTDEQIAGADGYLRRQLAALPWLHEQPDQLPFAAGVGLRTLIAACQVAPVTVEGSDEVVWTAVPELDGCLVLRRTADLFASVERTVQGAHGRQVHRLYYYVHEEGVLEEEVSASGIHHFTPLRREQVPARMLTLIDQDQVVSDSGDPVTVRASALTAGHEFAPRIADARAVSVLTSVRTGSDEARQVSIYASTSEVIAMEATDAESEDPEVRLRAVDAEELQELVCLFIGLES